MSALIGWFSSFYNDYLSINLEDYPNIGADFDIVKLIFVAAAAICIAFCAIDYHRKNIYLVVKQLMRHEAKDENGAKTLAEIGLSDNSAVKRALGESSQMKSVVSLVGDVKQSYDEYLLAEEKYRAEKKALRAENKQRRKDGVKIEKRKIEKPVSVGIDFSVAKFFINPEGRERASRIYNSAEISAFRTVLRCLLTVAVAICFTMAMPGILTVINGWLG